MKELTNFGRLLRFCGIDSHVLNTLILRSWGIFAGAGTIILIPQTITITEQGYFYTFVSILAIQIFFELGLNQVIIQLVSHEAAYLQIKNGKIIGDPEKAAKLTGLVGLLREWYLYASFTFFIVASLLGWFFFNYRNHGIGINYWGTAWCLVVLFTSINLYLSPKLALVEGTGAIGEIARLRLIQSIIGNILLWLMLLNDFGLFSTLAIPLSTTIGTYLWLRFKASWITAAKKNSYISWRHDVFPLQWRIGVSWASGYILFQLFTPIIFSTHGPVEAGRLGLSISIFTAITSVGISWITANTPKFTMYISRGEHKNLNMLFLTTSLQSTIFTSLLSIVIIIVFKYLKMMGLELANRVVDIDTMYWMGLSSVVNCFIFSCATYMRAHREEPMLTQSVVGAFITIFIIYVTRQDVHTMIMTNTIFGIAVGLPWTLFLLKSYVKRHIEKYI